MGHEHLSTLSGFPPAVILSGGSEIVSLGIAEALASRGVPLVVLSLGKPSLLRALPQTVHHAEIPWPPVSTAQGIELLQAQLQRLPGMDLGPLPTFASEDGGLRVLFEGRSAFASMLAVPGSPNLTMGGLDKAEFFDMMAAQGLSADLAPTLVLNAPEEASMAFERFGHDAVIKPALKPFDVVLPGSNPKIVTAFVGESRRSVIRRLAAVWSASPQRWVAQERLTGIEEGEADWWGMRVQGQISGVTAREFWKSPKIGGSGCWVMHSEVPELERVGHAVMEALSFHGVAEMPFLRDRDGKYRLLEINPRPWLQIALPEIVGIPMIYSTYCSLLGMPLPAPPDALRQGVSWVNPERMLAAALSGDYGNRVSALARAAFVVARADYRTMYSTPFRGIRRRWLARIAAKALRRR